jgi:hypothetical protein
MERTNRWRGVALVASGLFVGSILGPPVVQAATSLVTIEGAGSTNKAKVNSAGELKVNGEARPLAPASPWFASEDVPGSAPFLDTLLLGPTSSTLDVTSVSMSLGFGVTSGSADIRVVAAHVPSTATSCAGAVYDKTLWHVPDLTPAAPFTESFPTPLQYTPVANTKTCLFAGNGNVSTATVNAVGFLGG